MFWLNIHVYAYTNKDIHEIIHTGETHIHTYKGTHTQYTTHTEKHMHAYTHTYTSTHMNIHTQSLQIHMHKHINGRIKKLRFFGNHGFSILCNSISAASIASCSCSCVWACVPFKHKVYLFILDPPTPVLPDVLMMLHLD